MDTFAPDDFFALKKATEDACEEFTVDQSLALLRLSGHDSRLLIGCFPTLLRQLEDATAAQKREVHAAIEEVWRIYYPIGELTDVPFHLGTVLYQMDYYTEPLVHLERSLEAYGPHPGTDYNMALCYRGLDQRDKALKHARRALEMDADFEPARTLLDELGETDGDGEGATKHAGRDWADVNGEDRVHRIRPRLHASGRLSTVKHRAAETGGFVAPWALPTVTRYRKDDPQDLRTVYIPGRWLLRPMELSVGARSGCSAPSQGRRGSPGPVG